MTQRLHMVFGGELVESKKTTFKDPDDLHIAGVFPDYDAAYLTWKAETKRTKDQESTRYFIAHLHRLRDGQPPSPSIEQAE